MKVNNIKSNYDYTPETIQTTQNKISCRYRSRENKHNQLKAKRYNMLGVQQRRTEEPTTVWEECHREQYFEKSLTKELIRVLHMI